MIGTTPTWFLVPALSYGQHSPQYILSGFNGSLYVRQGYLANKKGLSAGGLTKRPIRLNTPQSSPLQLGLSGVGGKCIECSVVEVFPTEECKALVTSMAASCGVAPLSPAAPLTACISRPQPL